MVSVYKINPALKNAEGVYSKLEIPITVTKQPLPAPASDAPFCCKQVHLLQNNSNCQLDFSFANGQTQVIACLIGPSEAKFSSKQDFNRAFIEVNLKLAPLGLNKADLAACIRSCLD